MDDAPTTSPEPAPAVVASESQVVYIVEAIYEDGVIKPLALLELPPGTPITLQIATRLTATFAPRIVVIAQREHSPETERRLRGVSRGRHSPAPSPSLPT